jgi:hypothetical protein
MCSCLLPSSNLEKNFEGKLTPKIGGAGTGLKGEVIPVPAFRLLRVGVDSLIRDTQMFWHREHAVILKKIGLSF